MIDTLSLHLAKKIKSKVPDHPSSVEVLKYSLLFLLNAAFIVSLTMITSLFTGNSNEAVIALLSFAVLRQASGGIHLHSGVTCIIITTILMTTLSFASFTPMITTCITAAALIVTLIFAPSRLEKQTRFPRKLYPLLKWIAVLIVGINFLIVSPVLAATFLVQALSLITIRR